MNFNNFRWHDWLIKGLDLVVVLLALITVGPGFEKTWCWLGRNSGNIASWVQAVGSIIAIWVSILLVRRQFAAAQNEQIKNSKKRLAAFASSFEMIRTEIDEIGAPIPYLLEMRRLILEEWLADARAIPYEHLSVHDLEALQQLRTSAIRIRSFLKQAESDLVKYAGKPVVENRTFRTLKQDIAENRVDIDAAINRLNSSDKK